MRQLIVTLLHEIGKLLFMLSRVRILHKQITHPALQLLVQIRALGKKKKLYWSNAIRGWRAVNRRPQ